MLPHTGSSATPAPGAKVRSSKACSDPAGYAPIAPTIAAGMRERSGSSARTSAAVGSWTTAQPGAADRGLRVFVAVRLMRHARADVAAFERAVIQLREV